jgi:co-chaperonin GroES (HSP10)
MRKQLLILICSIFTGMCIAGSLNAAVQTGYIFDIQGSAQLMNAEGKKIILKKGEHLLYAVKDGDRIKVEKGKVVIASLKDSKGYEVGSNSEAVARPGGIVAVKGSVSEIKGLHTPGKAGSGSIGGFVVRGAKPCIKAVSPVNTSIISTTPTLNWENRCSGDKQVMVKIISGDSVLFSRQTREESLAVPGDILGYNQEYRWIVDSGKLNNISGGVFSLPSAEEARDITRQIALYEQGKNDISLHLSYVFFLIDNNLNDLARVQIKTLKHEYPDNEYLKKMEESIK